MRRRSRYSVLAVLSLFALLGIALILRSFAPPEVARLLPESDAIVYFNLRPIRLATQLEKHPVKAAPEYADFINATGIHIESDLDSAAFALHQMQDPGGPNGPVAYSEVMEGHFDADKLHAWFTAHAATTEVYAGHTIYTVPIEGRSLRVTTLGYDKVAGSNMPTTEQIHSIIDRYVAGASPFSGSSLLGSRYNEVPLFSRGLAWGIGHIGLPFAEHGRITVFGLGLPLDANADLVASASYRGSLHLRVEEIAPNEPVAITTASQLSMILGVVSNLGPGVTSTPQDASMHELLQSLQIEQHRNRVILTGNLPSTFVENAIKAPIPTTAP